MYGLPPYFTSHYGAQAVVISIDPKRVYVVDKEAFDTAASSVEYKKTLVELEDVGDRGPNGEKWCWWQVTVKGGRETRDIDAVQLAYISELLGAGEIMLNCIDKDGQNKGYDLPLIQAVQSRITIPVIASSGAGHPIHFFDAFTQTTVNAALAAGIFHRNEVRISEVKQFLQENQIPIRKF